MDIFQILLILAGLAVFETVNSVDNAIINADILSRANKKTRKMFLTWGLLIAVFVVRGIIPWLIIWVAIPSLGPVGSMIHTFSNDPNIVEAIDSSSPVLLVGTGTFLLCLFLYWFIVEQRNKNGHELKFYLIMPVILAIVMYLTLSRDYKMIIGSLVGCTCFFIMQGIRNHADKKRAIMTHKGMTNYSKLAYLEMIDASFSVDGVLGAFAFTLSVPLIMIGNGIGALVVRSLTMRNMKKMHKYRLIKNGAMYSIAMLSIIMLLNSFGMKIPVWIAPVLTFIIVGYFLFKSIILAKHHAA